MSAWRGVVLATIALLALTAVSCTPIHSTRVLGQPLSQPQRIHELAGLWADEERFYLVNVEDEERGVLRVGIIHPKEGEMESSTVVVREHRGGFIFNEEDSVLRGQYAFAHAALYGADQLILWLFVCEDMASRVNAGEFQGQVFQERLKGRSGFLGDTEVNIVLEDLTEEQLSRFDDPHTPGCDLGAWPITRLRRFR